MCGRSCPATCGLVVNAVTKLDHAILKAFDGVQIQEYLSMTPRDEWNAIPDEYRGHRDDKLVDHSFVEERGNELAAAHQPDVFAGLLSKPAHERSDCAADE